MTYEECFRAVHTDNATCARRSCHHCGDLTQHDYALAEKNHTHQRWKSISTTHFCSMPWILNDTINLTKFNMPSKTFSDNRSWSCSTVGFHLCILHRQASLRWPGFVWGKVIHWGWWWVEMETLVKHVESLVEVWLSSQTRTTDLQQKSPPVIYEHLFYPNRFKCAQQQRHVVWGTVEG